ncbi:hypothetical protein D3C83_304550 [compost metagenome]
MEVSADERGRFDAPSGFRALVADILSPGSAIIVTPESLTAGSPGSPLTVIGNEES